MSGLWNLYDSVALKCHGLISSDEEDSSGGDGEPPAYLKPPPMEYTSDMIVVIKAKPLAMEQQESMKKAQNARVKVNISTQNYFKVLEQSTSDEDNDDKVSVEEQHGDNRSTVDSEYISSTGNSKSVIKKKNVDNNFLGYSNPLQFNYSQCGSKLILNQKYLFSGDKTSLYPSGVAKKTSRDKAQLQNNKRNENEPTTLMDIQKSSMPIMENNNNTKIIGKEVSKGKRYRKRKARLSTKSIELYDAPKVQAYIYSIRERGISFDQNIDTRTSWDVISKNNIHRSDMLIEQEYDHIIGPRDKSLIADCQKLMASDKYMNK